MESASAESNASRLLKAYFNKHDQKEQIPPDRSTASVVELTAKDNRLADGPNL